MGHKGTLQWLIAHLGQKNAFRVQIAKIISNCKVSKSIINKRTTEFSLKKNYWGICIWIKFQQELNSLEISEDWFKFETIFLLNIFTTE